MIPFKDYAATRRPTLWTFILICRTGRAAGGNLSKQPIHHQQHCGARLWEGQTLLIDYEHRSYD
jgi:hypothetical protein